MLAWAGNPEDPSTQTSGVAWILAVDWVPYQLPTFVTPAFAGYVSGHSTFSRAAAEVMTAITGSPFFPGGLGEWTVAGRVARCPSGPERGRHAPGRPRTTTPPTRPASPASSAASTSPPTTSPGAGSARSAAWTPGPSPSALRGHGALTVAADELRVAVIGFGLGGRVFHAPLIEATPGMRVATIVTVRSRPAGRARARYPGAAVVAGADAIWSAADDHDLVVITTPNVAHVPARPGRPGRRAAGRPGQAAWPPSAAEGERGRRRGASGAACC